MARDRTQHISIGLNQILKKSGMDKKLKEQRILDDWMQLVGDNVGKVSKPERITDKVLFVRVKSMTWRTELLFQQKAILQRITEHVGKDIVNDIRFIS